MPIDLGFRARPWQDACFQQLRRFSVLVCHRRSGKSVLAVMLLIHRALSCRPHSNSRFAYIAPERAQAKKVSWDYLKRYATKVPNTKVSEVELYIEFPNGARINVEGADDPDRIRGIYLDGVVLDELSDMRPSTWGEVVRPALADRKGWALFIGTPKGLNLLSELYYQAQGKEDWFSALYTINDTHALDQAEIESARRDMSQRQFAQEFMCDFSAGDDDVLIPAEIVDAAVACEVQQIPSEPLVMGVDVARFGSDETVICIRNGKDCRTIPWIFLRGKDTMAVAARVTEEALRWGVDQVFVDEGGIGGGVLDRLHQLGLSAVGVNNGSKSDWGVEGHLVANKGAEIWVRMREWLKSGGAIPNDNILRAQLGSRRYGFNQHSQIVLEKKADLKKRGLPSSDRADSMSLTLSYPCAPRAMEYDDQLRTLARGGKPLVRHEYDPLAAFASNSR